MERPVRFISSQYHEAGRITTLVDFYGFQDRNGRNRAQLGGAILDGTSQRTTGFDPRFVLPYVPMREFEGLLFSDIGQFQYVLDGWNEKIRVKLTEVRQAFASPKDINDSPQTAPSKRLLNIFDQGTCSKTEHGPIVAEAIGIDQIRAQCAQFGAWVNTLQAWCAG